MLGKTCFNQRQKFDAANNSPSVRLHDFRYTTYETAKYVQLTIVVLKARKEYVNGVFSKNWLRVIVSRSDRYRMKILDL